MEQTPETKSIIVVDDDETVRNVIARTLQCEGYQVATASSGREALEITAVTKFDVMFLDIMMPGMNGQDVLTMMTFGNPDTPVVMLSALPDAESEALNRGAFTYLRKPVSVNDIITIAHEAVMSTFETEEALVSENV